MDWLNVLAYTAIFTVVTVLAYIAYMSRDYHKLHSMGIKIAKYWPGLGNAPYLIKEGLFYYLQNRYNEFAGEKVYGVCEPGRPSVGVRNLDMIRDISIKHANCFTARRSLPTKDPLWTSIVANAKGNRWKRIRSTMTPAFSSGKIKRMSPMIEQCTRTFLFHLREASDKGQEIELKTVCSCFAMDAIAATGFSLEIDSANKDCEIHFLEETRYMMDTLATTMTMVVYVFLPFLVPIIDKLKISLVPRRTQKFFSGFIHQETAKRRKDRDRLERTDYFQILLSAESETAEESQNDELHETGTVRGISHIELQGHVLAYFMANFDAISTATSFTLHLLAHHPECCIKAQEELDEVLGGRFPTNDNIQNLDYLDMCVNESMRLYPPGLIIERECTEKVTVHGITFPEGMQVIFPVAGIHYDPEYWPDPYKFDPDRFLPENKEKRHPYAFLPFGLGPRQCPGRRLGQHEVKVALAAVLQEMTPVTCAKSVHPVTLLLCLLQAKEGLWVKMVKRQNKKD